MKLRKIFDEEAIRPKPGLTAEQMPAEVEDPFTGEMKPYKGGVKKSKEADAEEPQPKKQKKVKDAVSEAMHKRLYNSLFRQVPRMIDRIYPTHKDDAEDVAAEIYREMVTPRTSDEDIEKLKAEDEANGVEHSADWYKYEQTKYPKEKAKIEQFDADKIGGGAEAFDKFVGQVAKNQIINMMRMDRELEFSKNTEGKNEYNRVIHTKSLDKGTVNGQGDVINPVLAEAESKYGESEERYIDYDKVIERLNTLPEDERNNRIRRLKAIAKANPTAYPELAAALGRVKSEVINPRTIVKREQNKKPIEEQKGYARTASKMRAARHEDFPFGVKPELVSNNKHEKMLRFTFPSKEKAEEAAEKHNAEMEQRGYVLNKRVGSKLTYKLK